jgi:hypothetical protein
MMSVEFHSEVEKIKSIIGRYISGNVNSDNYRVRVSESTGERYVRVEFDTGLSAFDILQIDLERLENSVHKFLSGEYYTLAVFTPIAREEYWSSHVKTKVSFVVKFFVD